MLAVTAFASTSAAQPTDEPTRYGLSISGGVSLGAYEAGVNWALIELIRRAEQGESVARRGRPNDVRLDVVTGASAGNINAFLVAREWCESDAEQAKGNAKNNWFWRAWVDVGLQQLFPAGRSCREYHRALGLDPGECDGLDPWAPDDGLLSRKGMRRVLESFESELSGDQAAEFRSCQLPLGVTTTRSEPTPLTIGEQQRLEVDTQRYVVPLMACAGPDGLVFRNYQTGGCDELPTGLGGEPTYEELGKAMYLPHGRDGSIAFRDIARVIQASSAFPAAFGPVDVNYCEVPPSRQRSGAGTPGSKGAPPRGVVRHVKGYRKDQPLCARDDAVEDTFLDGGVFDNVPLALGVHMDAARNVGKTAEFIYIDPDERRGPSKTFDHDQLSYRRGFGQLTKFAGDFVGVARQYELQTLARQPDIAGALDLETTSRFANIYGEHIVNFSALIARPFREADFHAGVYDALRYWADKSCTAAQGDECRTRVVFELLDQIAPAEDEANAETRWVTAKMECVERNWVEPQACSSIDVPDGGEVVAALVDAQLDFMRRQARASDNLRVLTQRVEHDDPRQFCHDNECVAACADMLEAAAKLSDLESGYMARLTEELSDVHDLGKLMRARHVRWETADEPVLDVYPEEQMEAEIAFIERWDASLQELVLGLALRNRSIEAVERHAMGERLSEAAEFGLLTWRSHTTPRWRFVPSTIPFYADDRWWERGLKGLARAAVPHTMLLDLADGDFSRIYEYRPIQSPFFDQSVSFSVVVSGRYRGRLAKAPIFGRQNALHVGGAFDVAVAPIVAFEGVITGGLESPSFTDPDGSRWPSRLKQGGAAEFRIALVDKIVIGGGLDATFRPDGTDYDPLFWVGVRDIAGLAYWAARFAQ